MTPDNRLKRIAEIIEAVDNRCLAADGPVTPTLQEMRQDEISRIYALAMGKPETWTPQTFTSKMTGRRSRNLTPPHPEKVGDADMLAAKVKEEPHG